MIECCIRLFCTVNTLISYTGENRRDMYGLDRLVSVGSTTKRWFSEQTISSIELTYLR